MGVMMRQLARPRQHRSTSDCSKANCCGGRAMKSRQMLPVVSQLVRQALTPPMVSSSSYGHTPKSFSEGQCGLRRQVLDQGSACWPAYLATPHCGSKGLAVPGTSAAIFECATPSRRRRCAQHHDGALKMALPCRISIYTEAARPASALIRPERDARQLFGPIPPFREVARSVEALHHAIIRPCGWRRCQPGPFRLTPIDSGRQIGCLAMRSRRAGSARFENGNGFFHQLESENSPSLQRPSRGLLRTVGARTRARPSRLELS